MNYAHLEKSLPPILLLFLVGFLAVGCEKNESSFFPLSAKRTWQYNIETKTANENSRQKNIIQSKGSISSTDNKSFVLQSISGLVSHYQRNEEALLLAQQLVNGEQREVAGVRATVFRFPLQVGTSWQDFMITELLQSYDAHAHKVREEIPVKVLIEDMDDTVTVPAGKFRHCMRIVTRGEKLVQKGKYAYQPKMTISITNTRWYAKGVGLVKEEHLESSDILQYPKATYMVSLDKFSQG